jgi:oligoribonuclease NrnB/cAMP/cGMP phosphodiesterase (DHH superfamily)
MQSGRAIRDAVTLEREKEMEFNTIMQALVKDIAEQLRPMVAEMVKQELANTDGDKALENIAANIDLEKLAEHIDVSTLAGELTDSQLSDIAGDIDLADLAGEFDTDKIVANVDMDEIIRDFFQNNSFQIRP